jgi:cell division protein ZipA
MSTNWSLMFNLVLLGGVVYVLFRMLKKKREAILPMNENIPSLHLAERKTDDIIAIRKIDLEQDDDAAPQLQAEETIETDAPEPMHATQEDNTWRAQPSPEGTNKTLMVFLLAKPQRQLAGYEMLQSILAAGLRFGEGQLFHRHQFTNGQGPILCSLAAATPSGTFDLQNIGAFNAKGLCLFMHLSGSPAFDSERLEKMLETAYQLAEGLDTYVLDDMRKPLTSETKARYRRVLDSLTLNEV